MNLQPAFVARIFHPTTHVHTQLAHGAITAGCGCTAWLIARLLELDAPVGAIAATLMAALYVVRENFSADSGARYWRARYQAGEISEPVLLVHLWDARRDWMIPVVVASAWWATVWWMWLVVLVQALWVKRDRHPHPGLVVDGLL